MENRKVKRIIYVKEGREWKATYTTEDAAEVYESLSLDLINKKIHCCTYIKSIKRTPNYNGTQTITVTYDNDCKAVYIVKN